MNADYKNILKYIEGIRKRYPEDAEYVCGYEAGCLGYALYHQLRDDQKKMLKSIKQQILALVLRHGKRFEGGKTYWTIAHMKWLKALKLDSVLQESLDEYLITYEYLVDKIERLNQRIEEMATGERYEEKVSKLRCFIGVKTHTALSLVVEVGDFERFAKAGSFSAFLGLVPSEDSSSERQNK